ncbi:MAG: hypothetical protein Q8P20_05915 [bacterium]|nr:hypothetical protein [bacterium]
MEDLGLIATIAICVNIIYFFIGLYLGKRQLFVACFQLSLLTFFLNAILLLKGDSSNNPLINLIGAVFLIIASIFYEDMSYKKLTQHPKKERK